ncbi:MAG: PQQ-dependent sugar dehydrogenase, partial [Polyangiaceae bacterium]
MQRPTSSILLLSTGVLLSVASVLAGCDGDGTGTTSGGSGGTTAQGGGGTGGSTGGSTTMGGSGGTTSQGGTGGSTTMGGSGGTGGSTGTGGTGTNTGSADCSPPEGTIPPLKLTQIANGLTRPVLVKAAPGDDTRLFIVEQNGRIQVMKDGVLLNDPFLDITDRVRQPSGGDERGLLGLAFHPDYKNNGRFFVFYTDKNNQGGSSGDQNIAEYTRSDNPDLAIADANGFGTEAQNLIKVADTQSNHNGGMIDFSPVDGYLYIGLGDGGGAGDNHGPIGNGQNLATMWGKILRIDVDAAGGGKPYGIPAGNMTAIPAGNPTSGTLVPEIWDFGLRNPWRFAFDPCNGDLFIGDVGQGAWEEVDYEKAGDGNKNYGWKYLEGTHDYSTNTPGYNEQMASLVPPIHEYSHNGGACSIS